MDYTLKFENQAQAQEVLFTDNRSNFPEHAIDVIGIIYKPTGIILNTQEGDVPEMAEVPGWHVNIRGPESSILAEYNISVKTPVRAWA